MSSDMPTAWIGLGANLGDARGALRGAVHGISALPQTRLLQLSSLYRSAPVDAGGPDYLNAVAVVETGLAALELLDALQAIELAAGRERPYRNAPRTLDLDLLRFGEVQLQTARLMLPHPRMLERAFVLQPMAELSGAGVTAGQLDRVADQRIERIAGPQEWCGFLPGSGLTQAGTAH
jgi:2-amino-4-hydroxy-6-hydroxymethyldihydropteridine diphosphokinase